MIARGVLAAALIAAAAAGVSAQRGGGQGRGGAPAPIPADRRYIAIGCVSRDGAPPARGAEATTPQRFLITDARGDKPIVYRLEGSTNEELTFHVGHTVEMAGTLTPPAAGATGPYANALTLKIASITYVSRTCSTAR